ncbi:MAG: glycosyltransferase family 4 protein [bacterium]|nr:glycosyltransferase family 4 protein [bacterium]
MKNKKKIVILTISDLEFESNLHRKAVTLRDEGYDVTIYCAYGSNFDPSLWEHINIVKYRKVFSSTPFIFMEFFVRCFVWILSKKPDLFISYDVYPLFPLRIKHFFDGSRYIYDSVELFQGLNSLVGKSLRRKSWYYYEKWGIRKAVLAFTVCRLDSEHLKKEYPFINTPEWIRNIPDYKPPDKPVDLRKLLNIPRECKIGIYQGAVLRGRGLENIIKALPDINNFTFVVTGNGVLLSELKRLTVELKVENKVYFTGGVPFNELSKYTAGADFGLTIISGKGLSYYHALPNKLFEYIQAEIPIIGSKYPEIENVIDGDNIGITVNPENVEEIRDAIMEISDSERYADLKKNLNKIKDKYSWKSESESYLKIIEGAFL